MRERHALRSAPPHRDWSTRSRPETTSSPWREPRRSWPTPVGPAAREAFVSGLDTIFVVTAVIAFAGSVLSLLVVRDRDLEREVDRESEGRPAPEAGPAAA